jgi:hypothetical protein
MDAERRTTSVPTIGLRVSLTAAVLLVVWTVYFLLSPVHVTTPNGRPFDCGSVVSGPKSSFARGVCGSAPDGARDKAIALGVSALVVAVGGFLTFGMRTSESWARPSTRRRREDDEAREAAD